MQASICPADRQREEEEAASVRMPPLGGKEAFPRLTQSIQTGRRRHSGDPSEAFLSDLRFDIEGRRRGGALPRLVVFSLLTLPPFIILTYQKKLNILSGKPCRCRKNFVSLHSIKKYYTKPMDTMTQYVKVLIVCCLLDAVFRGTYTAASLFADDYVLAQQNDQWGFRAVASVSPRRVCISSMVVVSSSNKK